MRLNLSATVLSLTLLGAATAHASDMYPAEVAAKLQLDCVPGCQLCHLDASGGPGKINPMFGTSLKAAGATGGEAVSTIAPALVAMETAGTDSDKDGAPDIAELRAGEDPNGAGSLCGGPKFGCGAATIAPSHPGRGLDPLAAAAGLLSLFVGLFVWRRRRAS